MFLPEKRRSYLTVLRYFCKKFREFFYVEPCAVAQKLILNTHLKEKYFCRLIMGLSHYLTGLPPKKERTKPAKGVKNCRVCGKEISKDNTETALYYSHFCSERCKEKYVYADSV